MQDSLDVALEDELDVFQHRCSQGRVVGLDVSQVPRQLIATRRVVTDDVAHEAEEFGFAVSNCEAGVSQRRSQSSVGLGNAGQRRRVDGLLTRSAAACTDRLPLVLHVRQLRLRTLTRLCRGKQCTGTKYSSYTESQHRFRVSVKQFRSKTSYSTI